jgi:hypothetical protein
MRVPSIKEEWRWLSMAHIGVTLAFPLDVRSGSRDRLVFATSCDADTLLNMRCIDGSARPRAELTSRTVSRSKV